MARSQSESDSLIMSIVTGEKIDDIGEDSGSSTYGGLVDIGGKKVKVYINVVETSTTISRMEVELTWEDGVELSDQEYADMLEITVGDTHYEESVVRHCMRMILNIE